MIMDGDRKMSVVIRPVETSENIKRVGVSLYIPGGETKTTIMFQLDQKQTLPFIIKDVCERVKLGNSEEYALQFDDKKVAPPPIFITETNRSKIQDGDILKLSYSAMKSSQMLVNCFKKGAVSAENLEQLSHLSCDITFAEQFINDTGYHLLGKFIENEEGTNSAESQLGHALTGFVHLMEHGIVSWDALDKKLLESVVACVTELYPCRVDLKPIKAGLTILESFLLKSSQGRILITELNLRVESFLHHINATKDVTSSKDVTCSKNEKPLQEPCLALINAMMEKCDVRTQESIRNFLLSKDTRQILHQAIFTDQIGNEMGYQLYCLQTRLFNLLTDRLRGAIHNRDEAALKEIKELRKAAFESDFDSTTGIPSPRKVNETKDYAKLGFKHPSNPLEDFQVAPPGALALDCMAFFANLYAQQYVQLVLENSRERADEQDCPIVQASVELTRLLAEILKIGEPPVVDDLSSNSWACYPMFFTKEQPFQEFFCICIQRFAKTWREMKASLDDFPKVIMVVREQIVRVLSEKPYTFDTLKRRLGELSFNRIQELRRKETDQKEEHRVQARPIRALAKKLEPEMMDLIRQNRLNRMTAGCSFKSQRKAKSERYIFMQLAQNLKSLSYFYGQTDQSPSQMDTAPINVSLADISEVKEGGKHLIVVNFMESQEPLQLQAVKEEDFHVWMDGLNALTNREMTSERAKSDLEELINMEIKLRLLDAEGIIFTDDPPPPVPSLPAEYLINAQ